MIAKFKNIGLRKKLLLLAVAVFIVGFAVSAAVYLNTEPQSPDTYEFRPEDSRMFRHNLEVYGGKISLAVSDFSVWFSDLWRGRQLAYTIAFITAGLCVLILLSSRYLAADHESVPHDSSDNF